MSDDQNMLFKTNQFMTVVQSLLARIVFNLTSSELKDSVLSQTQYQLRWFETKCFFEWQLKSSLK